MNSDSTIQDSGHTWLTIGKITGVHGLAGNLKVWSFAESHETFGKGRQVKLQSEGQATEATAEFYTIAKASARKKGVLLSLKNVDTIELAQSLVGKEIHMAKNELPDLETDTWYWEDLYGLKVVDRNLGCLGEIDRIFPTGANDILVVVDKDSKDSGKKGREVLIPMDQHFVTEVDMESGCLTTDLPQDYVME